MAKKVTVRADQNEHVEATYYTSEPTRYCFPEYGITVEAGNIEEARVKLHKILTKKE